MTGEARAAAPVWSLTCPAAMKNVRGRLLASVMGCSLVSSPPFFLPIKYPLVVRPPCFPIVTTGVERLRRAMALGKERLQPLRLLVGQPEETAHRHPLRFVSLTHSDQAISGRLMGLTPSRGRIFKSWVKNGSVSNMKYKSVEIQHRYISKNIPSIF